MSCRSPVRGRLRITSTVLDRDGDTTPSVVGVRSVELVPSWATVAAGDRSASSARRGSSWSTGGR